VLAWRRFLERRALPDDPVFGPWHDLTALGDGEFSGRAAAVIAEWQTRPLGTRPGELNPFVRAALSGSAPAGKADVAKLYGELLKRVYEESKSSPPAEGPDGEARRQLLEILVGTESPAYFPKSRTWAYMSRGEKDRYGGLQTEIDRLAVKSPHAPPRAMVLVDSERLYDPRVFVRGNPARPGDPVPRRFLEVLAGEERPPFPHGSGRLDLAKAITARENPLTARVLVNRVWMHHFGRPLVDSPSDFGLRTAPPTHPELLDWLAAEFVEGGWSVKRLHRMILLSAAYRQSSAVSDFGSRIADSDRDNPQSGIPNPQSVDPENRLLGRMNRRRLDLEAMRDSMLALAGRLDRRIGGRPVDVAGDPLNPRRTLYGLVDRQSLPGMYRAFD
ncbi:MAG TPA: DUF1553 domain-containing protein, partial [Planctomycetaceae bacterium]